MLMLIVNKPIPISMLLGLIGMEPLTLLYLKVLFLFITSCAIPTAVKVVPAINTITLSFIGFFCLKDGGLESKFNSITGMSNLDVIMF